MSSPQPEVPLKNLEVWAVEWEDAHWNSGEFEVHEITHRPVNYVTTGIKVVDDELGITLSSDVCETGSFRGLNFIPRKMVVKQWKIGALKPANPRNRRAPRTLPIQTMPDTPSPELLHNPVL